MTHLSQFMQYIRSFMTCRPPQGSQVKRSGEQTTFPRIEVIDDGLQRLESEAIERHLSGRLKENVISEDFRHCLSEFYDLDGAPILGAGASGAVRLTVHKQTGIKYAIKTLTKKNLKPEKIDALRQEILIMKALDHPNIITLHECFENTDYIFLVLELCTGGELLTKLNSQPHHHFTEAVACRYTRTILECIAYLHEHNIVHRDIKLENFIFVDKSQDAELKLIDFGLSKHFEGNEVIHGAVGTPFYVAPEVLTNNYSNKCDIWSIGVIAFMLLVGFPPFDGDDDRHTLQLVRTQPISFDHKVSLLRITEKALNNIPCQNFRQVSADAIDFVRVCLDRNVDTRPCAKELLLHRWFAMEVKRKSCRRVCSKAVKRLLRFSRQKAFVKICLELVAHTLTNDQIGLLREQFSEFDLEHNGVLRRVDIKRTLQNYGTFLPEDVERIFNAIDVDHDSHSIRYHEFIAATLSLDDITEANIRAAFLILSKHEEEIHIDNLRELLGCDSCEEELRQMLMEVDLDPEQAITYSQFRSIIDSSGEDFAVPV